MAPDNITVDTKANTIGSVVSLWLGILLIVAIHLRLAGADNYHYSQDESMHAAISSAATLSDVWHDAHYETHPPMLYIFTHYWMKISDAPAFVRSLQLIFGVAMIALYYRIGRYLKNETTGFCCAALVAFSYGCIIQSYVVRHYTIFMFFLSCGLYFYLRWRDGRQKSALLAYGLFLALACLTHFSGIFAIVCFLINEGLLMLRKRSLRNYVPWLSLNAALLLMALYLYWKWRPILIPVKSYFNSTDHLIFYALSYPLSASSYVFPEFAAPLAVVILLLTAAFLPKASGEEPSSFRTCFSLAWIALGLGMLLVATSAYPFAGTRRSLWTLPFLIPPVGYVVAASCEWLGNILARRHPVIWYNVIALAIVVAGWTSYDPAQRFRDSVEYAITAKQWQALTPFLDSLGPDDLIVTQKADAIVFKNIYPYLGEDPFTGASRATLVPYGNTHILFNPYDQRIVARRDLEVTFDDAMRKHLLTGIKRLVFPNSSLTNIPILDLMRCPALDGKIFIPSNADIKHLNGDFFFMTVPADIFIREALSPGGKAHNCLATPAPHG